MLVVEYSESAQVASPVSWGTMCSRSRAQQKYQKNLYEYQQRMAMCQRGYREACMKAQGDQRSMEKYMYQMRNCPFP